MGSFFTQQFRYFETNVATNEGLTFLLALISPRANSDIEVRQNDSISSAEETAHRDVTFHGYVRSNKNVSISMCISIINIYSHTTCWDNLKSS